MMKPLIKRICLFSSLVCVLAVAIIMSAPSQVLAQAGLDLPGNTFGAAGAERLAHAKAQLFTRVDEGATTVKAAIKIEIGKQWHLYHDEIGPGVGLPTKVSFSSDGVKWSKAIFPKPHKLDQKGLADDGGDTWVYSHEGTIVIYATGEISDKSKLANITVKVEGLTCKDNGSCVPYEETLKSLGKGSDELFKNFIAVPLKNQSIEKPSTPTEKKSDRSIGTWLLLAFIAGVILNFMPCVLPVVSIKVLSFVQQAGESRGRVLALGSAFSAGIMIVFLALAALAAGLGLGWGQQFQSVGFVVSMIAIVFAFGLSMLGVFEVGLPTSVGSMAGGGQKQEGLGDAFFKGILATLLATPCSGPALGSTLAWTLTQSTTTIFAIFTSLGAGMAFPYIVLTANPSFLKILPKPGNWMVTFKQVTGFVLLATVAYLMISLDEYNVKVTAAFLVFLGSACWVWGKYGQFGMPSAQRMKALLGVLVLTGVGAWFSFGPLLNFIKPSGIWTAYEASVVEDSLSEGKTVFIDFTADWCPNCKVNEKIVFESDEILALMKAKGVVKIKADITHDTPATQKMRKLMESHGAKSIPFLVVYPGGDKSKAMIAYDVVTKSQMREIFDACPDPK